MKGWILVSPPRHAASLSGVAYRAADGDLALAELFGMEIGEILGSGNGIRSRGRFFPRNSIAQFRDVLVVAGRGQLGLPKML